MRASPPAANESVAGFFTRRLGRGVLPLVDAVMTGIHAGDPARLSARHAVRRLVDLEAKGGIVRNLPRLRMHVGPLLAPREGMAGLVQALMGRLDDVRLEAPVTNVEARPQKVHLTMQDGERLEADHVVLACDAPATARLLGVDVAPPPVAPVAVVAFLVPEDVAPRAGYGVLAPEREKCFILGALYESALFPGRAPAGCALLRCFVGGRRHPERASLPEQQLQERTWRDLLRLGVVRGDPMRSFVVRTRGIPQLELGHGRFLAALPRHPRIPLAGIGMEGIGAASLVRKACSVAADLSGPPRPHRSDERD